MHQHEADLLDASECIKMQHVKNAAGYRMHQNAAGSPPKEINCTISNRCINGKLSRNTSWKINGKRISQKQLMRTICSP